MRAQIAEARRARRARADRRRARSPRDAPGTPYLAPQVLVDVDHGMRVMNEESFGPVVGIMRVASDEEAVALHERQPLRAHRVGLDARPSGGASRSATRVETGTVLHEPLRLSRPGARLDRRQGLGRGVTLSRVGYEPLTRPKSFHLRVQT